MELAEYGGNVLGQVRWKWYSAIPQSTGSGADKTLTTIVDLSIKKSGVLEAAELGESSGDTLLDEAALSGVKDAAPFPSPPANCKQKRVDLRLYFEYNREPSENRPLCAPMRPGVYRVGGNVKAPHVLYQPAPEMTEETRRPKRQGTVILGLTVREDGLPTDVCVAEASGVGLDEASVDAVKRWKFEPGTKDGLPVPTRISVEATFRLY
jgi:TonB family protein